MATNSAANTDLNGLILKESGVMPTGVEIGRGAYGRVFEVNYNRTLCAAKEVHEALRHFARGDELQKIKDDFLRECHIWSTLRDSYVVRFLGSCRYSLPIILAKLSALAFYCHCRFVLSPRGSPQISCYGNGEDAS